MEKRFAGHKVSLVVLLGKGEAGGEERWKMGG